MSVGAAMIYALPRPGTPSAAEPHRVRPNCCHDARTRRTPRGTPDGVLGGLGWHYVLRQLYARTRPP